MAQSKFSKGEVEHQEKLTLTWTIANFQELYTTAKASKKNVVVEEKFALGGKYWGFSLHQENEEDVGICLNFYGPDCASAEYTGYLKSSDGEFICTVNIGMQKYASENCNIEGVAHCRGWKSWKSLSKLQNEGFLPDGTLHFIFIVTVTTSKEQSVNVLTDLKNGLDSGVGADVKFIFVEKEGSSNVIGEIKAHKAILSLRSPFFATMFGPATATDDEVKISDIRPKCFGILLRFIYSGEVDSEWKSAVEELLYGANKYELDGLRAFFCENIFSVLNAKNVWKLRELASLYKLPGILESTIKFIEDHAKDVAEAIDVILNKDERETQTKSDECEKTLNDPADMDFTNEGTEENVGFADTPMCQNSSPPPKEDEREETQNSKSDECQKNSWDELPDMDFTNDGSLADTPTPMCEHSPPPPPPLTLEDEVENTGIEPPEPNSSGLNASMILRPLLSETDKEIEVLMMLSDLPEATEDFKTIQFVAKSISDLREPTPILESQEFLNLPRDILTDLLSADELGIPEIQIYKATIHWAENCIGNSKKEITVGKIRSKFGDLISLIRFPLMSHEEFVSLTAAHNLMQKVQWTKILTFIAINAQPNPQQIKIPSTLPFSSLPRLTDESTESKENNSSSHDEFLPGRHSGKRPLINSPSEDEPLKKIAKSSVQPYGHIAQSKNDTGSGSGNNSAGKADRTTTQDFLYGFNVPFPEETKASDKRKAAKVLEMVLKCIPSSELLKLRKVSAKWNKMSKRILRKRWESDAKSLLRKNNFDERKNWRFLQILNDSPENGLLAPVMKINSHDSDKVSVVLTIATIDTIEDICEKIGNRKVSKMLRTLSIGHETQSPHFSLDSLLVILRNLGPLLETLKISKIDFPPEDVLSVVPTKFSLYLLQRIIMKDGFDMEKNAEFLKMILELPHNVRSVDGKGFTFAKDLIQSYEPVRAALYTLSTPDALDTLLKYPQRATGHQRLAITSKAKDKQCLYEKQTGEQDRLFTIHLLPVLEEDRRSEEGFLYTSNYRYGDTPALKYLEISSKKSIDNWEELIFSKDSNNWNSTPPCSMEGLELFVKAGPRSHKVLSNLQMLFPNLKRLLIHFYDPHQLEVLGSPNYINNAWPNLETIELTLNCKDNEGSAIDFNQLLFGIRKASTEEIDTTEHKWWRKIPRQEIQGIFGSCKSLKRLSIVVNGSGSLEPLSDFTIYFALQFMQNLEIFEFKKSLCNLEVQLSSEALDFLIKKLPGLKELHVGGKDLLKNRKLQASTE